ncbi:MAG: hypothetical protein ABWZ26_03225 [Candidatus Nanopelagicales bacterium]
MSSTTPIFTARPVTVDVTVERATPAAQPPSPRLGYRLLGLVIVLIGLTALAIAYLASVPASAALR